MVYAQRDCLRRWLVNIGIERYQKWMVIAIQRHAALRRIQQAVVRIDRQLANGLPTRDVEVLGLLLCIEMTQIQSIPVGQGLPNLFRRGQHFALESTGQRNAFPAFLGQKLRCQLRGGPAVASTRHRQELRVMPLSCMCLAGGLLASRQHENPGQCTEHGNQSAAMGSQTVVAAVPPGAMHLRHGHQGVVIPSPGIGLRRWLQPWS